MKRLGGFSAAPRPRGASDGMLASRLQGQREAVYFCLFHVASPVDLPRDAATRVRERSAPLADSRHGVTPAQPLNTSAAWNSPPSTSLLGTPSQRSSTAVYTWRKSIACFRLPISSAVRLGCSPTTPPLTRPPTRNIGAAEPWSVPRDPFSRARR